MVDAGEEVKFSSWSCRIDNEIDVRKMTLSCKNISYLYVYMKNFKWIPDFEIAKLFQEIIEKWLTFKCSSVK